MTAQAPEGLIYEGQELHMYSQPLNSYFAYAGIDPPFQYMGSHVFRGYVGTWEILNDRLYLVHLTATLLDGKEASLETFFPGFPDRVFAHWATDRLCVPRGRVVRYVRIGYGNQHERYLLIDIESGVVKAVHEHRPDYSEVEDWQPPKLCAMT